MSRNHLYIPITRSGKSILASLGTQSLMRTPFHDVLSAMFSIIFWFLQVGFGILLILWGLGFGKGGPK